MQDAGCRDFFVSTWAEAEALEPWPGDLALSVLHGVGPDDMRVAATRIARPVLNSPEQVKRVPDLEGQEHIPRILGLRWTRR